MIELPLTLTLERGPLGAVYGLTSSWSHRLVQREGIVYFTRQELGVGQRVPDSGDLYIG